MNDLRTHPDSRLTLTGIHDLLRSLGEAAEAASEYGFSDTYVLVLAARGRAINEVLDFLD